MSDMEQTRDDVTVIVSEKTFRTLDALRRGGEDLDGMFLRLTKAAEISGVFAQADRAAAEKEAS
jgi:hypothetical protein